MPTTHQKPKLRKKKKKKNPPNRWNHKTQIGETIWPTTRHQCRQHHTTCSPSSAILSKTIIGNIGNPPISTKKPTNLSQNPSSLSSYSLRCSSPHYPTASSRRDRFVSRRDRLSDSMRERKGMREAWQWRETERGDDRAITGYYSKKERGLHGLKYIKLFWHSVTVPSHMLSLLWACMPNVLYIWHLTGPLLMLLRIWLLTILGLSMLFVFYRAMWCKKMCNII